jgi:hypothetical protein
MLHLAWTCCTQSASWSPMMMQNAVQMPKFSSTMQNCNQSQRDAADRLQHSAARHARGVCWGRDIDKNCAAVHGSVA